MLYKKYFILFLFLCLANTFLNGQVLHAKTDYFNNWPYCIIAKTATGYISLKGEDQKNIVLLDTAFVETKEVLLGDLVGIKKYEWGSCNVLIGDTSYALAIGIGDKFWYKFFVVKVNRNLEPIAPKIMMAEGKRDEVEPYQYNSHMVVLTNSSEDYSLLGEFRQQEGIIDLPYEWEYEHLHLYDGSLNLVKSINVAGDADLKELMNDNVSLSVNSRGDILMTKNVAKSRSNEALIDFYLMKKDSTMFSKMNYQILMDENFIGLSFAVNRGKFIATGLRANKVNRQWEMFFVEDLGAEEIGEQINRIGSFEMKDLEGYNLASELVITDDSRELYYFFELRDGLYVSQLSTLGTIEYTKRLIAVDVPDRKDVFTDLGWKCWQKDRSFAIEFFYKEMPFFKSKTYGVPEFDSREKSIGVSTSSCDYIAFNGKEGTVSGPYQLNLPINSFNHNHDFPNVQYLGKDCKFIKWSHPMLMWME